MNLDTFGTDPSKTFVRPWEGIVVCVNQKCKEESGKVIEPLKDRQNKDWGYRVQVRIFGEHTSDKTKLPDKNLPWVEVWAPATAGSGNQTPQIKVGDHVSGFSILDKSYLTFVKLKTGKVNQPTSQPQDNGFTPFTEKLPTTPSFGFFNGNEFINGWNANIYSQADVMRMKSTSFGIPCPKEILNVGGISTEINNLIKSIEQLKKGINDFSDNALNGISKIQENIQKEINKYSQTIAGYISFAIKWIQEQVIKKLNLLGISASSPIPLNSRFVVREGMSIIVEALYCFFNKILDNLVAMIADLLLEAIDYFINAPLCFIENFLTNFFACLFGALTSVLNAIAGALSGIISGIADLLTGILDIISDLLSLFTCDVDDVCPETKKWDIIDAAKENDTGISLNIDQIINQALSISDQFTNIVTTIYDPSTGAVLGFDFDDFYFDISSSLSDISCNGDPIFCGPPKVTFWGGGGYGATGNAIVSASGEILGVDIINSGSGYVRPPFVDISDDCGNGAGVIAEAIIGPIGIGSTFIPPPIFSLPPNTITPPIEITPPIGIETSCSPKEYSRSTEYQKPIDYSKIGVIGVKIIDPGFGFLSNYDGSLGGNGRVWASSEDTIVKRSNRKYDSPYKPGSLIKLYSCDKIIPPDRIEIVVPPEDDGIEYISPPKSDIPQLLPDDKFPINDTGKYPILMYICSVDVINSGISYKKEDKIKIIPDNGAKLIPTFNDVGALVKIDVINSGSYVTETPKIIIESSTGFNAKIIPILCTKPAKNQITNINEIVEVIDCVGKF